MTTEQMEFINELNGVDLALGKWAANELRAGSTVQILKNRLRVVCEKVGRQ